MLKKFKCKYCKKKFVIMFTHGNSVLPVEVRDETFSVDEIFDGQRHRSHLLNCKGRQKDWDRVKKLYMQFPQKTWINNG